MMRIGRRAFSAILAFAGAAALCGPAGAQQNIAQTLVYEVRTSGQGAKMPNGPGAEIKMNIAVKRTDPDGTRHASVFLDMAQVKTKLPPVDAMISPAGAIALQVDSSSLNVHRGMSNAQVTAASASAQAMMLQFQLRPFNEFAAACGAQQALRPGYAWHATSTEPPPTDVAYTVTGRELRSGYNAFAIAMQSANGAMAVTGQGYYDPVNHLVVAMHYEMKSPDGQQLEIVDIALANPM